MQSRPLYIWAIISIAGVIGIGFLSLGALLAWEDSSTALFHDIAIIVVLVYGIIGSASLASAVSLFFHKQWVRWLFLLDLLLAALFFSVDELPDMARKISSYIALSEHDQAKLSLWELLYELSIQIKTSFLIFAFIAICTIGVFRYFNRSSAASR